MEYTDVTGFAADAIGEPGARTFLLQFFGEWGRHTYLLEKGQVAALAAGAHQLVREVGFEPEDVPLAPVLFDEVPKFRVGQLGLGWDEGSELVVLSIDSVNDGDDRAIYRLSMPLLLAAAKQGEIAVTGGRPACPRCGLAMDPEGHGCPSTNGDLSNHRP